jgi:DNA-binding FadR family transcriptional regulator
MIKNVHGNTADLLGEAIVSGRYAPGAFLPPEPVLGEELGVSRTVVREVIKSLIAKGLVTTGPKVGTRVQLEDQWSWFDSDVITWRSKAGITPEFLRDMQDLRQIVEPAAVRLAAQRATPQDIAAMEEAFAGMDRALRSGGDYVKHDLLFHQGLLRAADNRLLLHMSRILSTLLRTSFELSTLKKDGPIRSLPLHRAVLDAVVDRDPDRAERAIRVLIDSAHKDIQEVFTPKRKSRAKKTVNEVKASKAVSESKSVRKTQTVPAANTALGTKSTEIGKTIKTDKMTRPAPVRRKRATD